MCFTVDSGAGCTRTHARAPRRRLFIVKHGEMKKSNSKTTIKAIEKNVIFTPPTRNAHFCFKPDGGGEEETIYIRSSMEEADVRPH